LTATLHPKEDAAVTEAVRELKVPFVLRGLDGHVVVQLAVNEDPVRWGHHLLGLEWDPPVPVGCPVMSGEIRYPGEGYGAWLYWLQVVAYRDSRYPDYSGTHADVPSPLHGKDVPYLASGVLPRIFDAPATDSDDADFSAHSLLAYDPNCNMSRTLRVLCGYSWGYEIREGTIAVQAPGLLDGAGWAADLELLRAEFPSWTFEDDD
jgi:hypothetical protein